jgi:putative heme-binding domain-containing protein
MEVVEGGDPEAGARVFFDARVTCAKCHRVEGRGGDVGPDLSNLAKAKTPRQILQSILHPSSERSPDYQGYAVVLMDGRTYLGTQFHYRGESADLLTVDGTWIRFALEDAEDYRPLDRSLMPDDLVDLMTVEELKDLMAYLTQSR